jgi:hypothetical protein
MGNRELGSFKEKQDYVINKLKRMGIHMEKGIRYPTKTSTFFTAVGKSKREWKK